MNFRDELLTYVDSDELMSRRPNPGLNEEGNPCTETGTAMKLLSLLGELTEDDKERFKRAIKRLEIEPGRYVKKPRTQDETTRDDVYGILAGDKVCDAGFTKDIYELGEKIGWILSTTGKVYWSSLCMPWDIAIYKLAFGVMPAWYESFLLGLKIKANALFGTVSGKRRILLILDFAKGKSDFLTSACEYWEIKLDKKGGLVWLFSSYHGKNHIFTKMAGTVA